MSGHGDGADAPSPRTDLILSAVFLAFGAAVIVASVAMPTFTDQGTPLFVAPGLVPAFHGVVIGLLSVLLGLRSIARARSHVPGPPAAGRAASLRRTALATVLALGFAGGLIGRLPFWLASALFVFVFIMAFEWERGMARRVLGRNAGIALAIGLGTGAGITLLFQRGFLINMP